MNKWMNDIQVSWVIKFKMKLRNKQRHFEYLIKKKKKFLWINDLTWCETKSLSFFEMSFMNCQRKQINKFFKQIKQF